MEWEYLVILAVVLILSFYGLLEDLVSIEHATLILLGIVVTASVFLISPLVETPTEIGKLNISNFSMQMALLNITLGIPALRGFPELAFKPLPYIVLIGITTEESFRIGVFHLVYDGLKSIHAAILLSGIVFAAIHLYWQPTQWVFAITGGVLFSLLLTVFRSQTACVVSHFAYDMLAFQHIGVVLYFILSFLMLIFSQIPVIKKVEV